MKFVFSHPERKKTQLPVIPVFMPFAGCRVRCVFCSQTAQTGKNEQNLSAVLQELEKTLQGLASAGKGPVEVAFYGGTFTGLPVAHQAQCLEITQRWREQGLVARVRCSTRPDCIDKNTVQFLRAKGVSLVELGVQSFADKALLTSKRNYTADCVRKACQLIREEGLELGIQLMPGLPGASLEDSYHDISLAVEQKPSCVRLYPCLVFAETPLAKLWAEGGYAPLSLEETVPLLAHACLTFWAHDIPVIRMGVAPEPAAMEKLLAGPFHYSLGNMVRGHALYAFIADRVRLFRGLIAADSSGEHSSHAASDISLIQDKQAALQHMRRGGDTTVTPQCPLTLYVPERYQGEFWGFKGDLKDSYASLGVENVVFHRHSEFSLQVATERGERAEKKLCSQGKIPFAKGS